MTLSGGLSYDRYQANGHDEWMMRIGAAEAPAILFVPPLFEEMNRTRALLADVMRGLAAKGYSCRLPDMPGTGESERRLETCEWDDWRSAVREAAKAMPSVAAVASIRGGALLDDAAKGATYWRFAPAEGASLARDLARAGLASGGGGAGYAPSETLMAALGAAVPAETQPLRTVRLESDPRDADIKREGPALWRRSEPDTSPELAALLVADLDAWIKQCAGS